MINSAIYNCSVIHKRFIPKEHYFKYNVFALLIDLSELEILNNKISFFSHNQFNLISFYEKDHGNRDGSSLVEWVKENLKKNSINIDNIKIKLLCYPRIFGYVFNPLSVFYIYDTSDNLISILYEVKNTFGEQHTYIFRIAEDNKLIQHQCSKKFHVSPFIDMECNYFFRLLKPGQKISVIIDQYSGQDKLLYASQDGKRVEFTSKQLIKSYLKHPMMTFKIILAIHYEAFKLWVKGIKYVRKKIKIKNNITIEN
ncbi:MAG: hypothetical protein ABS01_03055 [Pelagibacteraceae bacterium BACL5 MAG-120705-bin12]|mgnify:FL=1|jgi:uncharacterized protein|uniref:DUF1365 domain-containing protein n=1 Tax=Candidatus Pelagibacter sp. TaxID=2024849 RepID=UPI000714E1BC|nr:MAG: hypothetical protein ABS04_01610 [Pelagibacteraceae bacterium BACL5 MAG-121015-bin10]KRO61684.1 MAG: hypothetical protein ABS01_03055 [Pelagibacteraceae bacterium BACL5 MAG-120705-bin12]KRO74701.1 MAG: hypothetical protein ABS02_00140 [Pelagibacteraceae bacterium BACL5 MAG-120813-bin20]MDA1167065.1 DUF1365 domain-containing protein [Pseudomonadota bacterium]